MASATSEALSPLRLHTTSALQTRALGRRIGAGLVAGDCLALKGELGTGKTVLAQGIVAGAGGGPDVRSPTFLLHAVHAGRLTVHHLDLYRVDPPVRLRALGIDEALLEGAVVVEWPERAEPGWFTGEVAIAMGGGSARELLLRLRPGLLERATR